MAERLTARIRRRILDVDLVCDFDRGPVTVLFGPSGAGKTTLLRCLAGLDRPDPGGRITLDDRTWVDETGTWVPARRRRVGCLFQDHALFPHLSVDRNVGYGLGLVPRRDRAALIHQALHTAGAAHLAGRPVRRLSGGEAQRVALARALAPRPRLLLLDEPLSALDAPTRIRLRTDLRRLLTATKVPAVLVTHDRADALALGDQIAVIIDGRLRQLDSVAAVFTRPADAEVARAVDTETVTPATVTAVGADLTELRAGDAVLHAVADSSVPPGAEVLVCIRAENVALHTHPPHRHTDSPRNHLSATITTITDDGPLLRIGLDAGFPLTSYITRSTREDLNLQPGSRVTAAFKAPAVHIIPRG